MIPIRRKILDLRAERKSHFDEMRRISDAAEARAEGSRDLTAEEATEYKRHSDALDAVTERVERMEREAGLEADQRANPLREQEPEPIVAEGDKFSRSGLPKGDEYRDAFTALVRRAGGIESISAEQRAALAIGADATGGYLVPDEFYRILFESAEEFSFMRQYGTVVPTGEHGDLIIPKRGARSAAVWLGEGAAYTESEPDFGQVVLGAHKLGLYSKASDEMVDDPFFDVLAFLAKQAGEAIGIAANAAYVNGGTAQTTKPNGIVQQSTVGVTLATGQTVSILSADSLIDLQHSIISPYRGSAQWLMHDTTVKLARKLKTTDNQYIWQPGLQAGQPDSLLGRPILIDPNMPVPAANAKSIVYGDLKAYWIRDVQEIRIKPLTELFALNGQVGIRASARTDGDLVDTAAVRTLVHSAT